MYEWISVHSTQFFYTLHTSNISKNYIFITIFTDNTFNALTKMKPKFKRNRLCSGVHYEESRRVHVQFLQELHERNSGYLLSIQLVHRVPSALEQFEMNLKIQIEQYKKNRR